MANGAWKGVHPQVFGHSRQILQNKFFDPTTPSMRKKKRVNKKKEKNGKWEIMLFIVAITSMPVNHPNADRLERRPLVPKLLIQIIFTALPLMNHPVGPQICLIACTMGSTL